LLAFLVHIQTVDLSAFEMPDAPENEAGVLFIFEHYGTKQTLRSGRRTTLPVWMKLQKKVWTPRLPVRSTLALIRGSSSCSDKSALGNTMASDDKKTKTSPAPKNETAVKKEAAAKNKDEGQPKNKITSDADLSKAEGSEKAADSPSGYSRGEGQKPVSKAYKDNWNAIYAKKKKR
jgi:hypothetical protein